jgi:hypothetical protein
MPLKTLGPIGPRAVGERVKKPFLVAALIVYTSILLSYHTPQDLSSDTAYNCIGKYKVYFVTRGGQ